MAREWARIVLSIWEDEDFTALKPMPQWLYLAIVSHRDLSYCGVWPWLPARLVRNAEGMSVGKIRTYTRDLVLQGFVLLDRQTGELLVRSYVRYDGVLVNPNMGKAVARAVLAVHSPTLRQTVTRELARLYEESPSLPGWHGVKSESPDLFSQVSGELPLEQFGKQVRKQLGKQFAEQVPEQVDEPVPDEDANSSASSYVSGWGNR